MASVIECKACKQPVSLEARTCPHCGYPLIKRKIYWWKLVTLGVIGVVVWKGVESTGNHSLGRCDSKAAKENVENVFTNAPINKTLIGLEIVDWDNRITTVSSNPNELVCKATVTLNDSSVNKISYRFYKQHDSAYVQILNWE